MDSSHARRAKVIVRGAVQGVGFRPFVYRLASEMHLPGWVLNSMDGVRIDVEGSPQALAIFLRRLKAEKPPHAVIQSLESSFHAPAGYKRFEIRESDGSGERSAVVLPDLGTCPDCLREIFDPENRRYRYPFTNCTHCGPRFSIIESLPYDRANTSMKGFTMCCDCAREYHDPLDRRFHAQPNACPLCGPQLELWDGSGDVLAIRHDALLVAVRMVRDGKVVALKGVGGFQLIVDATNEAAVTRLRLLKRRPDKPFATLFPSLEAVRSACELSETEERLLVSAEAPIVLLRRDVGRIPDGCGISPSVAPCNPNLGVMLPYSPLHHLFMTELGVPVVATSGNVSDEPICIDECEALERLGGIADYLLVHDRPIVRPLDDSIVRVLVGDRQTLRRARGYAPFPVQVRRRLPDVLAVGAHLKNTVAVGNGSNVFVSQHIGDLQTAAAHTAFDAVLSDLPGLYGIKPGVVACDLHPGYHSTRVATGMAVSRIAVQHHYAHILACMAEHGLEPPVLGIVWDGSGFGTDGTVWGGEFLLVRKGGFDRVAHFRRFRLPGSEAAVREPRRAALGLLHELLGDLIWERTDLPGAFTRDELTILRQMLSRGIHSPVTSSAGRLFDAVAAITGLRLRTTFEGQAAMDLEFAVDPSIRLSYPFQIRGSRPHVIDWGGTILKLIEDVRALRPIGVISAKFHHTLAEIAVEMAKKAGEKTIVLTGGCFQNRFLTERVVARLEECGFHPYWPQRIPPNDGGIALGQVMAVAAISNQVSGKPQEVSLL